MRRIFIGAALLAVLACPRPGAAQTIDVAGVTFPNTLQVADRTLRLNGTGIRYKLVFKVYAAALYLGQQAATPEAVLAETGPLHMRVVMFREIDANELGKLFTKGMEQNAPRAEFSRSIPGILRLSDIFSSRKTLKPGEWFALQWEPGIGTVILINGKPEGAPIKEPEFFSAVMRIWLGKSPADSQLKDALLGKRPVGSSGYNN